jgi:hypothetical protein
MTNSNSLFSVNQSKSREMMSSPPADELKASLAFNQEHPRSVSNIKHHTYRTPSHLLDANQSKRRRRTDPSSSTQRLPFPQSLPHAPFLSPFQAFNVDWREVNLLEKINPYP